MCIGLCSTCRRMTCDARFLNYISLALGLMSFGALSLAVATDYWLFSNEPLDPKEYMGNMPAAGEGGPQGPGVGGFDSYSMANNSGMDDIMDDTMGDTMGDYPPSGMTIIVHLHSGLWRACTYYPHLEPDELDGVPTTCTNIGYFQSWERIQGGDTTNSILRAIRKSSPSIVISLFILIIALGLCTVGNSKQDHKTLAGSVLYIFSALGLAIGVIFYISAVNDEVSHRKPPENPDDPQFTYHYGWAFFFAGSSFIFSMGAAVTNISGYLKRFNNLEDMVNIMPGLQEKPSGGNFSVSTSREIDESDYMDAAGTQNPTIIL